MYGIHMAPTPAHPYRILYRLNQNTTKCLTFYTHSKRLPYDFCRVYGIRIFYGYTRGPRLDKSDGSPEQRYQCVLLYYYIMRLTYIILCRYEDRGKLSTFEATIALFQHFDRRVYVQPTTQVRS